MRTLIVIVTIAYQFFGLHLAVAQTTLAPQPLFTDPMPARVRLVFEVPDPSGGFTINSARIEGKFSGEAIFDVTIPELDNLYEEKNTNVAWETTFHTDLTPKGLTCAMCSLVKTPDIRDATVVSDGLYTGVDANNGLQRMLARFNFNADLGSIGCLCPRSTSFTVPLGFHVFSQTASLQFDFPLVHGIQASHKSSGTNAIAGEMHLDLACNIQPGLRNPKIEILPTPTEQHPVDIDESMTIEQLTALRRGNEDLMHEHVYGFTGPRRTTIHPGFLSWEYEAHGNKPRFGDGYCFWVDKITIEFPPIHLRLASELRGRECAHQVALEHEQQHAADIQRITRTIARDITDDINKLNLPSQDHQSYVISREKTNAEFEERVNIIVRHYRERAAKEMKDAVALLDTPERYQSDNDRCKDWP